MNLIFRVINKIKQKIVFKSELNAFTKLVNSNNNKRFNTIESFPQLNDKTATTGFDRHYIYHTAWAARKLKETNTLEHTDISSTLYFSAIASAFTKIHFYDYRPAELILDGLISNKADLSNLPFKSNSIKSLSCMHTIEHVGLGRYGDPVNVDGDLKAMNELARVLEEKGNLYIVVPVSQRPKICYNAHRIYSADMIVNSFQQSGLKLQEFTLIKGADYTTGLIKNPKNTDWSDEDYACGCFWFTK